MQLTPIAVVIFEVLPAEGRAQEYFDLALELKPRLEQMDGFIGTHQYFFRLPDPSGRGGERLRHG